MTSLIRLYDEQGQSPWLDNLTRPSLRTARWRTSSPAACGG